MRELIQSEFLTPLADVFGPHGPKLADELAKRVSPITGESMRLAAERMIRTRRAKGFPPFPECLMALGAAGKARKGPISDITAKNYSERAIEFCKANSDWPIIDREANKAEWEAWRAYFLKIGYLASHSMMNEAKKWGVPALHPAQFDRAA